MAAAYGQVPQHDHDDDDRNYGASPSMSFSPAHSSSPMPFLPAVESTFTPLSMNSDVYSGVGVGVDAAGNEVVENNSHDRASHKKVGSTATTRASVSINTMVQSLSPTRATNNRRSEYGLLSSETTTSSPSSSYSPNSILNRSNTASIDKLAFEGNLPFRNVDTYSPDSRATESSTAGEKGALSRHHQPILVKPIPIARTASTKSISLRHPTPDSNTRSSSYATNIAQLEATAEKLSMTSSIEDAIRDLHEEQKRNDSRRSSILAASIGSIPEHNEATSFLVPKPLSTASSILETNTAARYGGYSPAGFVTSPNSSLLSNPTRLRSGSGSLPTTEPQVGGVMSRQGPGKSSVRSVRSASKPTLTDIAEMEPTTLTPAAMDAADKLAEEPDEDALQVPRMEDADLTPNAEQYSRSDGYDYWDQAVADAQRGDEHNGHDGRPQTSGSTGTFEQAERAFADFDGAHCPSDVDPEESLFLPSFANGLSTETPFLRPFDHDLSKDKDEKDEEDLDRARPVISGPIGPPTVRPKSYMDPETGQNMLFYPARVPLMLNLPQKLSKKPKAEARNARRSQVLEKMTETNRQSSTNWLPEFLPDPLLDTTGLNSEATPTTAGIDAESRVPPASEGQHHPQLHEGIVNEEARKSRLSTIDLDKRKSGLGGLPPQLRASAFFDLPSSELPTVQLKDGSAMATLDSILDASAKAPVSAFTDHAFAGTLGSEIYGTEKKRKSHMKQSSTTSLLEPKKRGSFLHLRKPSAFSRHSTSQEEKRNASLVGTKTDGSLNNKDGQEDERQRLSNSIDGQPVPEGDQDHESEEEELLYDGPPTTLLAELQLRKQQQKLRTRPVATAFPNGLHSTLLEMDTVAQIEHNARKGKKINLAWEDPNMDPTNDSEDEDTPLGLLMAARGQGNDMTAAIDEVNRPLGLMERRDMEDNEPLSRRRDRLQGREGGLIKQRSMMTLGQGMYDNHNTSFGAPSPQLRMDTPEEEEVGETLGERMRRLKAREQGDNPLPQARPVSTAFSVELLSQIGDAFKDESDDKQKSKPKEEETLGQRRRRLQAEREAREGRVASKVLPGDTTGNIGKLTKRHSLADVLGMRNGSRAILNDPRVEADRVKQEEAARYRQTQEQKMAMLRNQMPPSLSTPNLNQPGGYMAGRFNDGTGGGVGQPRTSTALGGYPGQTGVVNNGMMANAYGPGGAVGGQLSYGIPNGYAPTNNPYVQPQPPQMDRVERWRQSVLP